MERPDTSVSVVVPTFRKKELLAATLNALCAQTYHHEFIEVVVADDCSCDGTQELLEGISTSYSLVSVRHEQNRGRAAARNSAIRKATGDLVIFLDDDMRAEPRLVSAHVRSHRLYPGSVVIGNALTAPELGTSNALRYLDTRGVHKLGADDEVPARYFLTNNSSVARSALVDVGMFDETFRNYGFEDTELAFRLERNAGLAFRYCPDAVAYHIHFHSLDQLLEKRYESAKGSLRHLLRKHPDRAAELSVELLLPESGGEEASRRLRRAAVSAAMSPPAVAAARAIAAGPFLGRLTFKAIDLLIADSYRRGLSDSLDEAS